MYREAYGIPQIPALKPQGFRTDTGHRILGEHHFYLVTSYQLSAISYQLSAISYQLSKIFHVVFLLYKSLLLLFARNKFHAYSTGFSHSNVRAQSNFTLSPR